MVAWYRLKTGFDIFSVPLAMENSEQLERERWCRSLAARETVSVRITEKNDKFEYAKQPWKLTSKLDTSEKSADILSRRHWTLFRVSEIRQFRDWRAISWRLLGTEKYQSLAGDYTEGLRAS